MSESTAALLGALAGGVTVGVFGVLGTYVASYVAPRRLQSQQAEADEARQTPRKRLLREMLDEPNEPIRSFNRLRLVTGTSDEDCRRLLIEIGARGVSMRGGKEGWALIERYPLNRPAEVDADLAEDEVPLLSGAAS